MRKLSDSFSPPPETEQHRDSADLLRCGWNRNTTHRCQLPGSIKPQGESHHLCRWHAYLVLFSNPRFASDRAQFMAWLDAKRRTWIPVCTADVWLRPAEELFSLSLGAGEG